MSDGELRYDRMVEDAFGAHLATEAPHFEAPKGMEAPNWGHHEQ